MYFSYMLLVNVLTNCCYWQPSVGLYIADKQFSIYRCIFDIMFLVLFYNISKYVWAISKVIDLIAKRTPKSFLFVNQIPLSQQRAKSNQNKCRMKYYLYMYKQTNLLQMSKFHACFLSRKNFLTVTYHSCHFVRIHNFHSTTTIFDSLQ